MSGSSSAGGALRGIGSARPGADAARAPPRSAAQTWNEAYLAALEPPGHSLDKYTRLANIVEDFSALAGMYGRIIIMERALSDEDKSVKVWEDCGGAAGGSKYLVQGERSTQSRHDS